jgi:hypothetical protein
MNSKSINAWGLYLFGAAILLGTVLFRLRLLHMPIDRDEGEFAYAGWRMLNGGVPYLDYYNMKMPGIYGAYALLFFIFGYTIEAIRLGLILVNLANAFFVFRLASGWGSRRMGIVAAICYLVFAVQVELQGTCSHAEAFAMVFALPGMICFFRAQEKKSMPVLFSSGLLFGLAFLVKQPALSFAVMAGLLLLVECIKRKQGWHYFVKSSLSLLSGAILPLLVTAVLLASVGAGRNFKLFAFDYAQEYISYLTLQDGWHNCVTTLSKAIMPNAILWTLVAVSFPLLIFVSRRKAAMEQTAFFIFSFIAVAAGYYFRPHYFQFLLPAAAILAASAISAWENYSEKKYPQQGWPQFISVLFLAVAIALFVSRERTLFSIRSEEDFVRHIYGLDFFNATKKAGEYIAAHSEPGVKVAILGAEPEIWFYAKRQAASGYMYVYPLLENHRFASDMRIQFYEEVRNSRPEILVYTSNEGTWYASPAVHAEMMEWYTRYRDSSFKRIALIDMPYNGSTVYHWTEDTAVRPGNAENYIEIYRRK